MNDYTLSPEGLALIKAFEGFSPTAYPDPGSGAEPWTIGFGTTRYFGGARVQPGDTCTEEEAALWLRHDLEDFQEVVRAEVTVPITQSQFDALVSFVYNVGPQAFRQSTLLRLLNAGHSAAAANQFPRWNKSNGKVLAGLTRRRLAERDLFNQMEA